jgi:hypothetical protein
MASLLARAEHWLRPADQLDYAIRRWLIPIRLEMTAPDRRILVPSTGLSRDLQAHIGSCLRAQPILPSLSPVDSRAYSKSSKDEPPCPEPSGDRNVLGLRTAAAPLHGDSRHSRGLQLYRGTVSTLGD